VTVIGAGYVGLVTGACLADAGNAVTLVEKDPARRNLLLTGRSPIHEPGLDDLLTRTLDAGHLTVTDDMRAALGDPGVVIIAVGTPPLPDGRADLTALWEVVADVRAHAREGTTLVIKSTVPPGTGARVDRQLAEGAFPIPVVSCPEFLREGSALRDVSGAERVVVGSADPDAAAAVGRLMNLSDAEVVSTNNTSAELIKYGSNAFLAMKISFINEMANLCELLEGDIDHVSTGMGHDSRIGSAFLSAGLGFGGSCFPKDVRALQSAASREGYSFWMLKSALEVNDQQRMRFVQKIRDAVGNHLGARRIALLGLAFKPGTDDMRSASSVAIANRLTELGATVVVHDPVAMEKAALELHDVEFAPDPYAAVTGADAVAIITEWDEYKQLDWTVVRNLVGQPIIVDGRNCLDAESLRTMGFNYHSIGRPSHITRWNRRVEDDGVVPVAVDRRITGDVPAEPDLVAAGAAPAGAMA